MATRKVKSKTKRASKPRAGTRPAAKKKSVARPKASPRSLKKPPAKPKASVQVQGQSPKGEKPPGEEVGKVIGYFRIPSAGIVKITKGSLKVGDLIWISGHTTDLRQTVSSMQIDRQPIQVAKKGQEIGIQVNAKVRRNDRIFKVA